MPLPPVISININTNPATLYGLNGNIISINGSGGAIPVFPKPQPLPQVLGLVGLNPCSINECRVYPESEYINPVIADIGSTDSQYNDTNTFICQFAGYNSGAWFPKIVLQEQTGGVWSDIATLNNNNNGTYYAFGSIPGHYDYFGYKIDWRKVLINFGEGIYRICLLIYTNIGHSTPAQGVLKWCMCSEPFCLKAYSCENVFNTVKFEMSISSGVIGHHEFPNYLIDLCNWTYTDSIRFEGFFNYEKDEYDRKLIRYNNGVMYHLRDEVIKKFELMTGRLPYWLHSRFRAYALMADKLFVTDYNLNNPNYNLKHKGIVCDSGYEPVWIQSTRYARVKVQFKEDQQNLIRRRCCSRKAG